MAQLTPDQRAEVAALVAGGMSRPAVARRFGVSSQTVGNIVRAAQADVAVVDDPAPAVAYDVTPPAVLAPIPVPVADAVDVRPAPPTRVDASGVCPVCRPPQGVHPAATSFTCQHGHWLIG